jgi:hypothetical protein
MSRTTLFAFCIVNMITGYAGPTTAFAENNGDPPVAFRKIVLTDKYYCDGINFGDFNQDGAKDIVAGPFWWEGPGFEQRHAFYPPVEHEPAASPTNSMFSFVYDFNQDGWDDILVIGRVHMHSAYWYENPAGETDDHWAKHYVFERIQGENPPFGDLTGDGKPELICHWEGPCGYVSPDWDNPSEPWSFHPLTEIGEYDRFYHGEGIGDIDGDGLNDLVLNDGWWKNPGEESNNSVWESHPFRFSGRRARGGAQMPIYDIDGDGYNDVVSAIDSHGWGFSWYEQIQEDGGRISFLEHKLMGDRTEIDQYGVAFTQPHAIDVADIDGDGLQDIVVGKRLWAHGPDGDIEPNESPVVYWFRLTRDNNGASFTPYLIDDESGVGLQIVGQDVTNDGRCDILTVSKLGVFLFIQE